MLSALPVLVPLAAFLALFIKAVSPGPVLFRQTRIGHRGRRFTCLKFRTMFQGAETQVHEEHCRRLIQQGAPLAKLDGQKDPRIIPGGRFLRLLGLDELPQLVNVWRGEMSLVGPRPCVPAEFDRSSPAQHRRLEALPGITGLWQVRGKNTTTFVRMIELDLEYIEKRCPAVDCGILLRTPAVIVAECARAVRRCLDPDRASNATISQPAPSARARA
ncbi:MAG: sugar transferase [Verrucomicrobiales bacterium]|nr:sugar transferase [Verrucomicrobiales bacterium]